MFEEIRIRVAGSHDGYPRRATFGEVKDASASPGQIMLPGVTLNFTTLSNRTYVRVLGTLTRIMIRLGKRNLRFIKNEILFLGCLGYIILISRPVPTFKEYLRGEAYLGRFVHGNLFAMTWVERMLQVEADKTNKILDWILMKFFRKPLYHSVLENSDLYR